MRFTAAIDNPPSSVGGIVAKPIADAFGYAQSQRNNHGLSEAAGLIAIGARLRGAEPRAAQWIEVGRQAMERMIIDQIAEDGWYIQHSFTYARVALDQLTIDLLLGAR